MPKNRWLYMGLLIIAAAACIWDGAWLTKRIEFAVPYAVGVGAILIIVGLVVESKKKKEGVSDPNAPNPPKP